jgi:hypothetical protein
MRRLDALEAIYPRLSDLVVVTIMGAVAAELQSLGHRPNFFYLQHAMGLASSLGLGIALCRPDLRVIVLDGDGSVLMNLGGLTTLAHRRATCAVVFDNENLLSVGGFGDVHGQRLRHRRPPEPADGAVGPSTGSRRVHQRRGGELTTIVAGGTVGPRRHDLSCSKTASLSTLLVSPPMTLLRNCRRLRRGTCASSTSRSRWDQTPVVGCRRRLPIARRHDRRDLPLR